MIPKAFTDQGKLHFECAWCRIWATEADPFVIDGQPGVYICRPCVYKWPGDFPTQPSRTAWRVEPHHNL